MCPFAVEPKNTAIAPSGIERELGLDLVGIAATIEREHRAGRPAPTTVRRVGRARAAAVSAPMTVPTPRSAMRNPASPAPPWKVSFARA